MADRQTGTVWTHLDGSALKGPMAGEVLEIIPLVHTTWQEWTDLHPDTTVLDNNTSFRSQYRPVRIGSGGLGPMFARTLLNVDNRLPGNEVVVGVVKGGESRAYPLRSLPPGPGAVNDDLGGEPIVVLHDTNAAFGLGYSRVVDGETLTFGAEGGQVVDEETGSVWTLEGEAVSGPLAGRRLTFVTSFITEWYGWSAFHPSTDIY